MKTKQVKIDNNIFECSEFFDKDRKVKGVDINLIEDKFEVDINMGDRYIGEILNIEIPNHKNILQNRVFDEMVIDFINEVF